MLAKKKKRFLTFEEQHEVIKKIKSGTSNEEIVREYGISMSTCCRLLSRESKLLQNFCNNYETRKKKTSKTSSDECLEAATLIWFQQARDRGESINGLAIQEKARSFNRKLSFSPKFKASNGWLRNFKRRHGIKSYEFDSREDFTWILEEKMVMENLQLDNIYNADECEINWQTLISFGQEKNINTGENEFDDKMTTLFCANANGSYKLPLLTICKEKLPECFMIKAVTRTFGMKRLQFLSNFNIVYTNQHESLMDKEIFLLWYKEIFIPNAIEHRKNCRSSGKIILILDNCPSHPSLNALNEVNKDVQVVYLPANVPAMIQPMNHDLMVFFKKQCKTKLLQIALSHIVGIADFLKTLDLAVSLGLISNIWCKLKLTTLGKIWKPLLGDRCNHEESDPNDLSHDSIVDESLSFPHKIADQFLQILITSNSSRRITKEDLIMWFETNDIDCGWRPLTDDEIAAQFINKRRLSTNSNQDRIIESVNIKVEQMEYQEDSNEQVEIEFENIKSEQYEYAELAQHGKIDPNSECGNIKSEQTDDNCVELAQCQLIGGSGEFQSGSRNNKSKRVLNPEGNRQRYQIVESEITVSEALDSFMKFKKWSETCQLFSKLHIVCIEEIQEIIEQKKNSS